MGKYHDPALAQSQSRETPVATDYVGSGSLNQVRYGRTEQSRQMRRGAGRLVTENGGPPVTRPVRSRRLGKSVFKKTGMGYAAGRAAARAVAIPAAVGVGRAILAGMGFYTFVSGSGAMFVVGWRRYCCILDDPGVATCPSRTRWQGNEGGEEEEYGEVEFHCACAKVCKSG